MLRIRRLPPTRVLRRPVYEIEAGPSAAHPSGWTATTTTPATRIDTLIGVEEAWALVDAADAAWTGGVGAWVSPDGVVTAEPEAAGEPPSSEPLAGRSFQVWEYDVGHGSVLFRSPMDAGHQTNLDLIFDKVTYLACPSRLTEPVLVAAEPEDHARLEAAIGAVTAPQRLFVLAEQGRRHLVVATSCRVIEHLADPLSSPFAAPRFSRDWWSTLLNGQGR